MKKTVFVIILCSIFVPELVFFLPVPSFIANDASIIYAIYYFSKIVLISLAIYVYVFWLMSDKKKRERKNGEE